MATTILLAAGRLEAATMFYLQDQKMCDLATVVAVGQVESVSTEVDRDRPLVRTRARIAVSEYVKAPPDRPAALEVLTVGGKTDSVATQCPGAPRFKQGEKVVVFLCPDGQGAYRVLALARGKYRVDKTSGGAELVRLDLDGLTQLDPETGQTIPVDLIPAATGKVYLEDLVSTLRRCVTTARSR